MTPAAIPLLAELPHNPHAIDVARDWDHVIGDVVGSLPAFAAELTVCAVIVAILLSRLFGLAKWLPASTVAFVGSAIATAVACLQWGAAFESADDGWAGLVRNDSLTVFVRVLVLLGWNLTVTLTVLTGVPRPSADPGDDDGPDFHLPLAAVALGSMLMGQANHLLMLFLAVEMASVPAYVLVGFRKGSREAGEAALKYLVFGAGAAAVMMYGASLLAGATGTLSFPVLGERLALVRLDGLGWEEPGVGGAAIAGVVFVLCGLAFKLSLVPFHFWSPDAFQGALAEVSGFLSVAPKIGAFALLVRFGLSLNGDYGETGDTLLTGLGMACAAGAAVSMTFGNLAAFAQKDLGRLLAYSTVAQSGTVLLGVAACFLGVGRGEPDLAAAGLAGTLLYLIAYLFLNLGAFAAVAIFRNRTLRTDVASLAGLGAKMPWIAGCFAVSLVGLVGLPPTAGFVGKLAVFAATLSDREGSPLLFLCGGIAAANTVASLFYYFRPIRSLYLDAAPAERPGHRVAVQPPASGSERAYLVLLAAPTVGILLLFGRLGALCEAIAEATLR
ncbi:NADH-quinone oxidoreductase subunit N [Alienimonas californiensis]|uniref:NADH-quinone oxidoreductase subunit N n=1 Tax=Alienimonas californiensis TaxID=2527989 RepID=A0A517P9Y4_9PLAN|nr:NADH-quinone oxidoreductase subunit N [Alienimonas californiensis]QDT16175.1 NADH-quinone oxidoreductase subunit N [Alienimonas californiensis]